MSKYIALPTWAIMRTVVKLKKDHVWHDRNIVLEDWRRRQSDMCRMFDYFFWIQFVTMSALIWLLFTN